MKKTIKFSFYVALFFVGLIANSSIADAQSTNPSLTDGSPEHTCYDSYEKGSRMYIINCDTCTSQRANDCADQSKCKH